MTGLEPRTSDIGSNRSTNWATQPLPAKNLLNYILQPAFYTNGIK